MGLTSSQEKVYPDCSFKTKEFEVKKYETKYDNIYDYYENRLNLLKYMNIFDFKQLLYNYDCSEEERKEEYGRYDEV